MPFHVVDSLWQFSVIGACDRNTYHTQLFDKNLEFWFHNVYNLCAQCTYLMVWLKLSPRHHMLLLRNVFVCVLVLVWFSNVPRERWKEGRERSLWWLFVCIHFKIEFVCDIFFPPFHSAYSSRRRMRWTESKNESSSNNNTFRNNLIWNLIVTFFPGSFFSLNELWNSGSSFWLHFIPIFPDFFFLASSSTK